MKRRAFLRASVVLPALAAAGPSPEAAGKHKHEQQHRRHGKRNGNLSDMNVILFMTDQERAIQHFPKGWAEQNLPGMQRLQRNGLTFTRAFCNSCMCSPSRATLMSGYFPVQHGVVDTLEDDMPGQTPLPLALPNIATVMAAAGYAVPYKGKWHLSKPATPGNPQPSDLAQYGFTRWDPPDAGANQDLDQFGGGAADNDGRFMDAAGDVDAGLEGIIAYLESVAAQQQPFFLTVSLVNPHDVLAYPNTWQQGGYDTDVWLSGDIALPATVGEDLSSKPTAQQLTVPYLNAGLGFLPALQDKRNYLNFYGNLMKRADGYLVRVLDVLQRQGLLANTLIVRTSDHGEMGMAHGGLRQKIFNFYEETLRVPLIYSNPRLYKKPHRSDALVSHVDLLPTLASLFAVPDTARANWQGVDYSRMVLSPSAQPPQNYVVFTFDDIFAGQPQGPYIPPPNRIVSIREQRYKLAKYYDGNGNLPDQWEMYDLRHDPLEKRNIAHIGVKRTKQQEQELRRLTAKLAVVAGTRLQPL